jgi:hypothetical protein
MKPAVTPTPVFACHPQSIKLTCAFSYFQSKFPLCDWQLKVNYHYAFLKEKYIQKE